MVGSERMIEGLVVCNDKGKVTFASGLGNDSRIKALTRDATWMAEIRHRRIQPILLDRNKFVGLLSPMRDGEILLISQVPSDSVLEFIGSVDFAYDILDHMLTDPFEAMTVIDQDGRLVYISPVHERFFGLDHGEANGRPVREIIENTRLDRVVASGKSEIGAIQYMRGAERVVSRVAIRKAGKVVGAMGRVMFKGPKQVDELSKRVNALESKVEFYRREAVSLRRRTYGLDDLVGQSAAIRRLRSEIIKVAPLGLPVLIRGESGTGKELVAQSLHRLSPRREGKMVMVNAAALPQTLVEAELFGYDAGAFTGADKKGRRGKFEQAADGTIFLDEIGDMPIDVQVKLLRVLQDHVVEPIGSERTINVDFRLITATNRDLHQHVRDGKFRLDLYYRISAITIDVPPLRQRVEDIPLLVAHFLKEFAERHGRRLAEIEEDAVNYLMEQAWPGNVRQLFHEIERALVFAEDNRITVEDFVAHSDTRSEQLSSVTAHDGYDLPASGTPVLMKDAVEKLELQIVRDALKKFKGNKKRVAEELGISRSYIYKLLGEQEA